MKSQADFVRSARAQISDEDWQKIVQSAIKDAKEGDKSARDFISHLVLPEKIDDEVSGEERAKVLIFRLATVEDYKKSQTERQKAEDAAK